MISASDIRSPVELGGQAELHPSGMAASVLFGCVSLAALSMLARAIAPARAVSNSLRRPSLPARTCAHASQSYGLAGTVQDGVVIGTRERGTTAASF